MKVYVVSGYNHYADCLILKIFANKNDAEKYRLKVKQEDDEDYQDFDEIFIDEHEVE